MRRILALTLTFLSLGGMCHAECGPDYASSGYWVNRNIIVANDRVYCLDNTDRDSLLGSSKVYEVKEDGLQKVLTGNKIWKIYSAGENILLEHERYTLDSLLSVAQRGVVTVILYDPETGDKEVWDRYNPTYSAAFDEEWFSFSAGNNLYTWIRPKDGSDRYQLCCYSAPFEKTVIETSTAFSFGHRTFALLSIEPHWLNSKKVKVSILDYATNTRYDLEHRLDLHRPYKQNGDFPAVLDGSTLFYLSADGINAYDLQTDKDRLFMSIEDSSIYSNFVIHGEKIIMLNAHLPGTIDVYDLNTGEQLWTTNYIEYPQDFVAYNNVLYLASEWGIEIIDLYSREQKYVAY